MEDLASHYIGDYDLLAIVATALMRRFDVPELDRQRILATTDAALLRQWVTRAATARSLADVFKPTIS